MAKVSRNILKSFFERGDKPTSHHFQSLIDSLAHLSEDRKFFGLRAYDPAREYFVDETTIFGNTIYRCTLNTTGVFNPAAWQQVLAIGAVTYVGSWDPSTNTPTLQDGVGSNGHYYVCSEAGNTTLDGISVWSPGDWAIFNGSVWQKISYSVVDDQTAAEVPFTPSGDITATNTQDAVVQVRNNTDTKLALKADKVSGATNGNIAGLDASGNLTDTGFKTADYLDKANTTSYNPSTDYHPATKRYVDLETSVKADKVLVANNGNFAGLNGSGNLTDSGFKASDFLSSDATAADIDNVPAGDISATNVQNAINELDAEKLGIGVAGIDGSIVKYDASLKAAPATMDDLKIAAGINNVPNVDTTNPANILQDGTHRFVSDAQISSWDGTGAGLGTHTSDFNNPHNVTKDQVGLGNVQNIDTTIAPNINQDPIHRFVTDAQIGSWDGTGIDLGTHTSDFNNPHNVTKDQVGLSNVQNVDATIASNITEDPTHRFVADAQISLWNGAATGLATHTSDFNNPHNVTKDQVGLSNVQNVDATIASNITEDPTHRFVTDAQIISWDGTGTNLTLHTTDTNNPHNVTKDQIGLANVPNVDTTIASNITEDPTHRFVTDAEKDTWNSKQGNLGYTPLNPANNLSDVANVATSRNNLGLGDSATKNVGTVANTVAAGDDARLSDSRHHKLYAYQFTDVTIGATTSETTVFSATINGGDIGPNGMVEIWTQWTVNNNGNTKTARIYFGGSEVKSVNLSSNSSAAIATRIMNRNSASAQLVTPAALSSYHGLGGSNNISALTVNTAANVTVSVTGQKGNTGNTMTLNAVYIILYK